jgi:hypothetical protein
MTLHPVVPFDPERYGGLLDDGELSLWAREAGAKYLISDVEALWLLAQALLLDELLPRMSGGKRKTSQICADGGRSGINQHGRIAQLPVPRQPRNRVPPSLGQIGNTVSAHEMVTRTLGTGPANGQFAVIGSGADAAATSINASTAADSTLLDKVDVVSPSLDSPSSGV